MPGVGTEEWRGVPGSWFLSPAEGAVAQLGERLLCKQEVDGSIPFSSTRDEESEDRSQQSVSFFLTSDFCVLKSLFVIVEREWSDRLKAGLEFRWFVPGAGRRLGPRGGV